jgi:hypothetical protein
MRNLVRLFHLANETVKVINATNTKTPTKSNHLSGKVIFTIVVASIIAVILLILFIWGCVKKKRLYEDYNLRPETFIRKPSFTLIDTINSTEHTFLPMKYYNKQSEKIHVSLKK